MASYYNTSNQRDVMPTLYLGDPGHSPYPESSLPTNMVYLNYSSAGSYSDHLASNSQPQQNCGEISVPTTMLSQDSSAGPSESSVSHQGILSNVVSSRLGEQAYGVWRDGRNEMLFMQPPAALTSMQTMNRQINNSTDDLVRHSVAEEPHMDLGTQLGILQSGQSLQSQRPDVSAIQGQGLSLSLGTQIPSTIQVPSFQFHRHANVDNSFMGSHQSTSGNGGLCRDDGSHRKQSRNTEFPPPYSGGGHPIKGEMLGNNPQCSTVLKQMHPDSSPYGLSGLSSTIPNSKYLKAAQQLLDEVVNVRKALKQDSEKRQSFGMSVGISGSKETDGGSKDGALPPTDGMPVNPQDSTSNSTNELSPAERQDLQNKMTKLLTMLDEVDRRYKQYYHQMQIVVSSFDIIAGCGAAKPYTALALQTISRHFRSLRDAINSQIRVTRRNLGEQDSPGSKGGGISRLRFVDQQLRQQRALQHIGMIQQHAWRPQRGLPESSVSILRAWLFEHFLHPYPKDSDKIMLARQTGLTRSQVSNWFINARVRLWKPMVEEMYKEETGDAEMDSNSSSDTAKVRSETKASEDKEELQSMKSAVENCPTSSYDGTMKSDHVSDVEMSGPTPGFQNSMNSQDPNHGNMKLRDQRSNADEYSLLQDALIQPDGSGRYMAYQMAEVGRFGNGGVSLTLGLQHCDGGLPVSGGQQSFVTVRGDDDMYGAASDRADAVDYDCMNMGNRRHRFGSSHLLHDFVA